MIEPARNYCYDWMLGATENSPVTFYCNALTLLTVILTASSGYIQLAGSRVLYSGELLVPSSWRVTITRSYCLLCRLHVYSPSNFFFPDFIHSDLSCCFSGTSNLCCQQLLPCSIAVIQPLCRPATLIASTTHTRHTGNLPTPVSVLRPKVLAIFWKMWIWYHLISRWDLVSGCSQLSVSICCNCNRLDKHMVATELDNRVGSQR